MTNEIKKQHIINGEKAVVDSLKEKGLIKRSEMDKELLQIFQKHSSIAGTYSNATSVIDESEWNHLYGQIIEFHKKRETINYKNGYKDGWNDCLYQHNLTSEVKV